MACRFVNRVARDDGSSRAPAAWLFPRSPMLVAIAAWDLQAVSGGRFELGLGTQVRGNIVGRYSTPWTPPVPRMREYVLALRAIFAAFQQGGALDFRGDHYRFTRLQPFFNPGRSSTRRSRCCSARSVPA